jgi:electron transport complex protein RnfC
MNGIAAYDDSYPTIKTTNAVIALDASQVEMYSESACIRCGRCVRACPAGLMPLRFEDAFNRHDIDELRELKINLCFECGCCAWGCPARRHLVHINRLAKVRLRKADNEREGT